LARLAEGRDRTEPGAPVSQATMGRPDKGADAQAAYRSVIVHTIPTEILVAYTALVGIVAGAVTSDSPEHYLSLRWTLLGIFTLVTPLTVAIAARLHRGGSARLPLLEMSAATTAALAWFLAMPGSPLAVSLHGSDAAVASACITVGAGALLSSLAPLLRRGSNSRSRKPTKLDADPLQQLPAQPPAIDLTKADPKPADEGVR
jgi:hypothetical protein